MTSFSEIISPDFNFLPALLTSPTANNTIPVNVDFALTAVSTFFSSSSFLQSIN